MSNIWIQATGALSRSLDPREREAVLGDFAELGISNRQAMRGLLGLVLRRQLRLWREWQPWFALIAVIVPVCPLLASLSDELGGELFPIVVVWSHHRVAYAAGLAPGATLAAFCLQAIALITWSWTCAFALGVLSRRTIWVHGVLFAGVYLALVATARGLISLRLLWITPWAWFPFLLEFVVVLLPAYCGLRQSAKSPAMRARWVVPLATWTALIGILALWTRDWGQAAMENWSHGAAALTLLQLVRCADVWEGVMTHLFKAAALTAPILYMLALHAFSHRRSDILRG
jgi:hypothetical protein